MHNQTIYIYMCITSCTHMVGVFLINSSLLAYEIMKKEASGGSTAGGLGASRRSSTSFDFFAFLRKNPVEGRRRNSACGIRKTWGDAA